MDRPYAHALLNININIPAFKLTYSKNGNKELESNLLVSGNRTETVALYGSTGSLFLVRIELFQKHH
jgi:murein L,D-transpeptidase YcbB/YkuD